MILTAGIIFFFKFLQQYTRNRIASKQCALYNNHSNNEKKRSRLNVDTHEKNSLRFCGNSFVYKLLSCTEMVKSSTSVCVYLRESRTLFAAR